MPLKWGIYVLAIALLFYLDYKSSDRNGKKHEKTMSGCFYKILEREIKRRNES